MLTVFKLFNNLASPILYQSVVANDLSSLVQGLSSYDNIELHARSTPSKDEWVAQTRDLRIVGFGPTGRLVIKLRDILAAGDWTTVGLTPRQGLTKSRQLALSAFDKIFQSVRQADTDLLEVPPFKSLRNLVLGQRHDRGWDFLKDISPNDLQVHQTQVGVFLYSHQPRSICLHANHGPFSGQMHHLVYDPNTHAATITRHLYDFDTDCPQIFCGARNRWMFYPGVVTRWRTDSEDQHRAEVFTEDLVRALTQRVNYRPLVRDGEEEWVEPEFGTTIEIYGLGMHAGARSHLLQQDDILDDLLRGDRAGPGSERGFRQTKRLNCYTQSRAPRRRRRYEQMVCRDFGILGGSLGQVVGQGQVPPLARGTRVRVLWLDDRSGHRGV